MCGSAGHDRRRVTGLGSTVLPFVQYSICPRNAVGKTGKLVGEARSRFNSDT
jgi:hypothetical protein